uniref:Uncharacterized protein n=1 Tax=Oryza brachyantha TaxID=4533 RepID=J3LK08_ORYBR
MEEKRRNTYSRDLRCWEGWKSSDKEVSGERASAETKHDRKAPSKATARPPALLTDLSELYDSVVPTEARERSRLSPGSLRGLALAAEPPPPSLLPIISVSGSIRARSYRRPRWERRGQGRRRRTGPTALLVWKEKSGAPSAFDDDGERSGGGKKMRRRRRRRRSETRPWAGGVGLAAFFRCRARIKVDDWFG